jgi:hypothetical protein
MNGIGWIKEHLDTWDLEEEYIEYFKNNVMDDGTGPYDGYFGIPSWKECLVLRRDVLDRNSIMYSTLVDAGVWEESVKQLKIITFEEYIEEFYPHHAQYINKGHRE